MCPACKLFLGLAVASISMLTFSGCLLIGDSGSSASVPKAPSDLTADAISYEEVDLHWIDHASNEDGFVIYRRKSSESSYIRVTVVGRNCSGYYDDTVSGNSTYYYYVVAYNDIGHSSPSNEVMVHTPAYDIWADILSGDDESCGCLGIEPLILILLVVLFRTGRRNLVSRTRVSRTYYR